MAMSGFDDPGVFFSDNFGGGDEQNDRQAQRSQVKKKLRDFLREFHVTTEGGVTYAYRCESSSVPFYRTTKVLRTPLLHLLYMLFNL